MKFTLAAALAATGGLPAGGSAAPETLFEGVATDSRGELSGRLFVALKGERFDGHDFVADVAARGAAGVLVERGEAPRGIPAIRVDDTLEALGRLGRMARDRAGLRVGAVTGSFGKTTTKDLAVALLTRAGRRVLGTPGNLNNRIGLPLTLLGARGDEECAVLELGISLPGEMAKLAAVAAPNVAIITGVGEAHTERLGSVAGVAAEKLALADGLREGGVLLLPHGEPLLAPPPNLAARNIAVRTFGWEAGADVRGEALESLGAAGSRFRVEGRAVFVPLAGRHNAANALAAWALARALGAEPEAGEAVFGEMEPAKLRGEIFPGPGGSTLLVDCYNANPGAVSAALEALEELAGTARKVLVLGEMRELGTLTEAAHRRVAFEAAARGVETLFLLGGATRYTADEAAAAGFGPGHVRRAADHGELAAMLREALGPGDWVLIKGSRGAALDRVVSAISEAKGGKDRDAL